MLSNTANRNVLTSTGGTSFSYTFKIYDAAHIKVIVADSDGQNPSTKVYQADYTLTGIGSASGGTVVFTTAVTAGKKVILSLNTALTQTTDLLTADALPAETLESALDVIVSEILTLKEQITRCVKLPESTVNTTDPVMPDFNVVTNQSKLLRLDSTGLTAVSTTVSVPTDVLTTKGDLVAHNGTSSLRLGVGSDYKLLMALASESAGVKWEDIHNLPGVAGLIGMAGSAAGLLDNATMLVWQRGTSFTTPTNAYTADRWTLGRVASTAAYTVSRSTDVPVPSPINEPLSAYSYRVTCNTADSVVDSTDLVYIGQTVAGPTWVGYWQRIFTLSFWVRSSVTGTYNISVCNQAANRGLVATYTINAANTWEWKTITVPASPSTGTWDFAPRNPSLSVRFVLMAGTGNTTVTTANTWETVSSIPYRTSAGQANVFATAGNIFALSSLQTNIGVGPIPNSMPRFEDEYARCQHYFQKSFEYDTAPAQNVGSVGGAAWLQSAVGASATVYMPIRFVPKLRTNPTMVYYNPNAANAQVRNASNGTDGSALTTNTYGQNGVLAQFTTSATTAANHVHAVHWTASADF